MFVLRVSWVLKEKQVCTHHNAGHLSLATRRYTYMFIVESNAEMSAVIGIQREEKCL